MNRDTILKVDFLKDSQMSLWDDYVKTHADATLYHLSSWRDVVKEAYGHRNFFMIAGISHEKKGVNDMRGNGRISQVTGVLPLFFLNSMIFGKHLCSLPFFDTGGILANNEETARVLFDKALEIARQVNAASIELRYAKVLPFDGFVPAFGDSSNEDIRKHTGTSRHDFIDRKVQMVLDLPASSDELMNSFKSKLRSQIKRPIKEKLYSRIGGRELIDDFYSVFCRNMRDLGSPVHSLKFIDKTFQHFDKEARLIIIYQNKTPVAGGVVIGFKDILENPWASSLREYSRLSPNMLLYWTMLEYACDKGYSRFNFGRSTVDEGTYRFKKQWGAIAYPLHWQRINLNQGSPVSPGISKDGFQKAIDIWKKLPVSITRVVGPMIRKNIPL